MLSLNNIEIRYCSRIILEPSSIEIPQSSLVGLLGRNGSGKSSLLRVIAGIDKPLVGSVCIDSLDLAKVSAIVRAKLLSFVSTEKVRIPNIRCNELVALGRAPYTDWCGRLTEADKEIVSQSLELVGMTEFAEKPLDTLSDGERQRVMIARALAQQTNVILLDEPTSFLDIPNRIEIVNILRNLASEQGKTIIFSTHELTLALDYCHEILMIDSQKIHYGTSSQMSSSQALQSMMVNHGDKVRRE